MEITKDLLLKYIEDTCLVKEGDIEITNPSIGAYRVTTPDKVDNKTVRLSQLKQWATEKDIS